MLEMSLISYLIVGFLGAILGSFLLHEYDNYGNAKHGLKLRSVCDHCGKQLSAKNLIPIFSFLVQGGRSSCCDKNLSNKYFISEIGLASFFMVCLYFDNLTSIGLLFPALLLIALIDEKYKEIPLVLNIYLLLWIALNSNVGENLISAALVGLFLLFLYWSYLFIKKTEGLGLGDIILLISISLYLSLIHI